MDVLQAGTEIGEEVIPQGFPLYAIIIDGDASEKWLVIGWNVANSIELWPMVVPIGSGAIGSGAHHAATFLRPPAGAQIVWVVE